MFFPFKAAPYTLGESRSMALSHFLIGRGNCKVTQNYITHRLFMEEYITLGHMRLAKALGKYIIPHHAIVKHVNNNIKLRVVFDASAHTSNGPFLSNILFTGPKLQRDIMDLLICCRLHRYMFRAYLHLQNVSPNHGFHFRTWIPAYFMAK